MTADTNGAPRTLGELALEVRSKNAGPFWMTLEAFMPDERTYRIADALITAELISELYHVSPALLQIFRRQRGRDHGRARLDSGSRVGRKGFLDMLWT
jgi:Domain of unknown function (DUF4387)